MSGISELEHQFLRYAEGEQVFWVSPRPERLRVSGRRGGRRRVRGQERQSRAARAPADERGVSAERSRLTVATWYRPLSSITANIIPT